VQTQTVTPQLTRNEAEERARAIANVNRYQIHLDVTDGIGQPGQSTFRSTTTVEFTAAPGTGSSFIDLIASEVRSATLNGKDVDTSGVEKDGRIHLTGLTGHNVLVVDALCSYSNSGEGLHQFVEQPDGDDKQNHDEKVYLYTQFEPADARRVFACFDQPDLKAQFDITVTAPTDWKVISNGSESKPEPDGGATKHTFATTKRMSTYVVAFIAGPYRCWEDSYSDHFGSVPLRIFCRESLQKSMDAPAVFDLTKKCFAFYHSNFQVPYPFGKYDQIFVPQFNYSGMENVGAVVLTEDQIFRGKVTTAAYEKRADTVAHELAHMWFGDLVTMKWWDDLWLNESFAEYASFWCQHEATDFKQAWTTFANTEKAKAYRQDEMPTTHPVIADVNNLEDVLNNFDGITYRKGASVLKQLVAYIGADAFVQGLRDYFGAHQYQNATFIDLRDALEHASGRDLKEWGEQWLRTTGINRLRADFDVDADGKFTRFAVTQSRAVPGAPETTDDVTPPPGQLRDHHITIGIYDDDNTGKLSCLHRAEQVPIAGERTDVPALIGVSRGKLVLVNDDDWTYCSQRLDPVSLQTVRARIGDIQCSLPRSLAWSTLWEMTRGAELAARDYVEQVAKSVQAETEPTVAEQLLAQTQTALRYYADPPWAQGSGWPGFADKLITLAKAAVPGSDAQLAYVNALCSSVLSPRHTELLHALLDTDDPKKLDLPKLQVDTDLRWRIIIALATAGAIDGQSPDSPFIDAAAAVDTSDQGQRSAAQARASRPQQAVKDAAWQTLMTETGLGNSMARAISAGFNSPGQEELLHKYISQYFATILPVWQSRKPEVQKTLATNLYPSWDVSSSAVDAAHAFLLQPEVPSALNRIVREGKADVKRSLDARNFDTHTDAAHNS
jgi:aminopeptidase N